MTQDELDALPEDGMFGMVEEVLDGQVIRRPVLNGAKQMSLRDAVMAWVGLPKLSKLSVVNIHPGDVIVAECECDLSEATKEYFKHTLETVWPETKIVVCDRHLKLKVVCRMEKVDAERAT